MLAGHPKNSTNASSPHLTFRPSTGVMGVGPGLLAPCSTCTDMSPSFMAQRTLHCLEIFKKIFSAFSPGQEFTTRSQKIFEPTGFQNTLSGMYSPTVFAAPGANLMEVHLFCLLACDRDACCDGFILTQVHGGDVDDTGWETWGHRSQGVQQGDFVGMR